MKRKVLLINWDNYPNNATGGVYAWEKDLINNMTDYDFAVVNLLSNPNTSGTYVIPANVTNVIYSPLYGCHRHEEFYKHKDQKLFSKILRTTNSVIEQRFMPLYSQLVEELFSDNCNHANLHETIFKLHKFLTTYDAKKCIEHPRAWEIFIQQLVSDYVYKDIKIRDAQLLFQIIQRVIQILSIKIPKVDLIHCSLAWFPSFIAIYAKIENNCPVIITEHGVAFRDLSVYHSSYLLNGPSSKLWKFFSGNIIRSIYSIADVLMPVCYANAKWAENIGTLNSKIKVAYNGIDTKKYRPMKIDNDGTEGNNKEVAFANRPTIVYMGRVEVLKDVINLIESMKYVKKQIPNVQCLIYGISTDLNYASQCVELVNDFGLNENVKFMGSTREPEKAYNIADVVVLCSIAEGFPYTIIEAMACKKPIVSTDVGGIREALEGCGLLVKSRHPLELSNALVKLLKDEQWRDDLGATGLQRVRQMYTIEKAINQYRRQYEEMIRLYEK